MWCIVRIVLEKGDFSDHNEVPVPVMYNLRSLCSTIQFLKGNGKDKHFLLIWQSFWNNKQSLLRLSERLLNCTEWKSALRYCVFSADHLKLFFNDISIPHAKIEKTSKLKPLTNKEIKKPLHIFTDF